MTTASEQKTLNGAYGALAAVTILTLVPIMSVAVIAILLFIMVFISLYIIRARAKEDSVVQNHMTFLIRTIWIVQFFGIITITLASLYLLPAFDSSALQPCTDRVTNMIFDNPDMDFKTMSDELQPCMDQMMEDNHDILIKSTLISGGPIILYLLFRLYKGGSRAVKGYRIANPKSWF